MRPRIKDSVSIVWVALSPKKLNELIGSKASSDACDHILDKLLGQDDKKPRQPGLMHR
jgi:hypothetical protein